MKKRLAAIATLAKIQKHELETVSSELIALQAHRSELQKSRDELERKRIEEAGVWSIEAAPYIKTFLESIQKETSQIDQASKTVDERIEQTKTEVIAAWSETKKTDHLETNILQKLKKEQEDREQSQREERTIFEFGRRRQSED